MIELPFACYCSELKVNPKNWQSKNAPIKKDWFVYYRFYDPTFKNNPKFKKGKLVILKGMNQFKAITERHSQTQHIIEDELQRLKNEAYNPITGNKKVTSLEVNEIDPNTPFIKALYLAEKRISCSPSSKRDLKSILNFVSNAAIQLRYSELPISTVSRKHFKQLLLHIDSFHGESTHRFNKIRSYLMMIYNELIELEATEINPLRDLAKKKGIQKLRKLPSEAERQSINEYLKVNHYRFWIFMNIFFHSGARLTEMMKVKRSDVDLIKQAFKITIKKGKYSKEVLKPIKNVALEYWEIAMEGADENEFIFSNGLAPGDAGIQSYQITKRWNRHIKKKLKLNVDFYSLKHLNLDETAALLDINAAAAMANHTSTTVTAKHYAVNESQRQNERLKQIENKFA